MAQPGQTDLLNQVRQPFNVNSLAQAAAAAALFDDDFLLASAQLNRAGLEQMRVDRNSAWRLRCLLGQLCDWQT